VTSFEGGSAQAGGILSIITFQTVILRIAQHDSPRRRGPIPHMQYYAVRVAAPQMNRRVFKALACMLPGAARVVWILACARMTDLMLSKCDAMR
jgi:hypothetical protein